VGRFRGFQVTSFPKNLKALDRGTQRARMRVINPHSGAPLHP
jgi:hypothetical protein